MFNETEYAAMPKFPNARRLAHLVLIAWLLSMIIIPAIILAQ